MILKIALSILPVLAWIILLLTALMFFAVAYIEFIEKLEQRRNKKEWDAWWKAEMEEKKGEDTNYD